jgi:ribosomal protein L29
MNKKEVKKELSPEKLLAEYWAVLVVLQMKNRMGQLNKTHQIKQLKKEIARLLTRQNQKY